MAAATTGDGRSCHDHGNLLGVLQPGQLICWNRQRLLLPVTDTTRGVLLPATGMTTSCAVANGDSDDGSCIQGKGGCEGGTRRWYDDERWRQVRDDLLQVEGTGECLRRRRRR